MLIVEINQTIFWRRDQCLTSNCSVNMNRSIEEHMTHMQHEAEEWWQVVQAMAGYITSGLDECDLNDDFVRCELLRQGFSVGAVEQAFDWIDQASLGGQLNELFTFLQPINPNIRIQNPLEKAAVSDRLWQQIERCRHSGLVSQWYAEQVLEGMRTLDTRDWEDNEVDAFVAEMLANTLPQRNKKSALQLLNGKCRQLYC